MSQQDISTYEAMKPILAWHRDLLTQILRDPQYFCVDGLTDDELAQKLANHIWDAKNHQGKRSVPIVHNRMKELVNEGKAIRLWGLDGRKHNFHVDVFKRIPKVKLLQFFAEEELRKVEACLRKTMENEI